MKPYFESHDGRVRIFHGDAREVLATLDEASCGITLTDPPFAAETHDGARTMKGGVAGGTKFIDYPPIDPRELREVLEAVARVTARWVIFTSEFRHAALLEREPPKGLKFVRMGVWVKPDGAPQLTGDRPGQGWEAVPIFHADRKGRMRWNGGGHPAVFFHGVERKSQYAAQKPLPLGRELVTLFSEPNEIVLDPFCGSGTFLLAALHDGHRAIGCDASERACELAATRVSRAAAQTSLLDLATREPHDHSCLTPE